MSTTNPVQPPEPGSPPPKVLIIKIDVESWFDWRAIPEGEEVDESIPRTELADGRTAVREIKEDPSDITITVEAETTARMIADNQAVGGTKSRNQLIAELIERTVPVNQSPVNKWRSITCEQDTALATYLSRRLLEA